MPNQNLEKEGKVIELLLDDIKKSDLKIIRDSSNRNFGLTSRSIAIDNYVQFIQATRNN